MEDGKQNSNKKSQICPSQLNTRKSREIHLIHSVFKFYKPDLCGGVVSFNQKDYCAQLITSLLIVRVIPLSWVR